MGTKKRVIIKRPDEDYGHVTNISFSLENLQNTVGGPIEVVSIGKSLLGEPIKMIINEEGKIRNLPFNFMIAPLQTITGIQGGPSLVRVPLDHIVGTVIICGMNAEGDDLGELPITFQEWKRILDKIRGCA